MGQKMIKSDVIAHIEHIQTNFSPTPPPFNNPQPCANQNNQILPSGYELLDNDFHPRGKPDWLRINLSDRLPLSDTKLLISEQVNLGSSSTSIHSQVKKGGTDALAYYLPFHFYDRKRWGIYLRASGIAFLASQLKGGDITSTDNDLIRLAQHILIAHETYHFETEFACSRAEILSGNRTYLRFYQNRDATLREEALANLSAFLTVKPPYIGKVQDFMQAQGPGYNEFLFYKNDSSRRSATSDQVAAMVTSPAGINLGKFLFSEIQTVVLKDHTYYVNDIPDLGFDFLREFPKYNGIQITVHSNDHAPAHFHIQKPPGTEFTKYKWIPLEPYDETYSRINNKILKAYLDRYGHAIKQRLIDVFPDLK